MKTLLSYCLLIVLTLITGCKKENLSADIQSQVLSGSWELRTSTGNRMPDQSYAPGNGNIFVFRDDNYSRLNENVETKNGTFRITKAHNPNTGKEMPAISFDDNSLGTVCYSIEDDVLTFYWSPLVACGSISTYAHVADEDNSKNP